MCLLIACQANHESRESLSLAGDWLLRLDSTDVTDTVRLPGTTDTNLKGYPNLDKGETTHLSRLFRYQGKAWYTKAVDIPDGWKGKSVWLVLERTKPTHVWVDNVPAGASDDISTPQEYDLSPYLTPGKHQLTVMVDNGLSVPPQLLENSHAYTESTQTNWNGMIGDLRLEARPIFHIQGIQVYPNAEEKTAEVRIRFSETASRSLPVRLRIDVESFNTHKKQRIQLKEDDATIQQGVLTRLIRMGDDAVTWSEFDPALYRLTVRIDGIGIQDCLSTTFGLRDFRVKGTQFTINGLTTFLRGKHDACVFPLTGHVPMDTAQWRRYFRIAKEYGINHCRFHSWCPPKACFEAADIEGFYLQPELPFWGKLERKDTALVRFLTKEGLHIQEAYGNHASFVMMAIGNELSGDQEIMTEMIARFREADGRHLYASGSNDYLGFNGPAPGDDYFTTCRVPGENVFANHTRGSFSFADAEDGGYINHTYPSSTLNFETAIRQCPLPIIGHETGQFQCYPNYQEIAKYTGVLKPWNLEVFRQRLADAGMSRQADDFFKASGAWMTRLYRAEMEMALRTRGMAGFQLLDLQDYPGQGTALVGILDAFMDNKGLISPEEWRESCDRVVLLALLPKFCYAGGDTIQGMVEVANYTPADLTDQTVEWVLSDSRGKVIARESVSPHIGQGSLTEVCPIRVALPSIHEADTYTLALSMPGTSYRNHYPLWIYPEANEIAIPSGIKVVHQWSQETERLLAGGAKVLWFPDAKRYKTVTVDGLFQTDYWNYRMFKSICEWAKKPVSPGTLGLLMDPDHPVFAQFPTEFHTDWQWFAMVKQSHPLILDRLSDSYTPIVQVIDNVERNHKLGLIQEFKVGTGKLLICMTDLDSLCAYPEARQLYRSIIGYMASSHFTPQTALTPDELASLFTQEAKGAAIKKLGNISYDN